MELRLLYHNVRDKVKSRMASQPAAPPRATLAALPPEILHLILRFLCKHCSRPADPELTDLDDDGKPALWSLCLVCRALRAPAQAVLVHSLWLRFGLRGYRKAKDDSHFAALRTLLERPDLARSVRTITLGGSEFRAGPERSAVVRDAERTRTFRTGSEPAGSGAALDDVVLTRLARDLFVSLAHNLTDLSFPLGFRRGGHRAADVVAAARFAEQNRVSGGSGASLPNLQILTLFPERGTDFVVNDPRIRTFLAAAPNLRRLVLDEMRDMISSMPDAFELADRYPDQPRIDPVLEQLPIAPRLESIYFQNCLVENDGFGRNLTNLRTLLASAPNLRRFQFSAGFSVNFHRLVVSYVLTILEPFHDSLVDLGLRFNAALPSLHDGGGGTDDALQALSRFRKLRVLRLDEATFCHSRHPGQPATDTRNLASGDPVPPECLARILPPSVRVLHLELMYGCTRQHDALRLAECVAGGRFPNLAHVQIETMMQRPPHGAARVESVRQAVGARWLGASQDETDVVLAFLKAKSVAVWMRNVGCFDDWDVEAFVDLD